MARIKFPPGEQRRWLKSVMQRCGLSSRQIARTCGFHPRTVNDWIREEYTMPELAIKAIASKTGEKFPEQIELLKDNWNADKSSRMGAKRRMEIYGPPGTAEGRRKGGRVSQIRRKEYPEQYSQCNLPKSYPYLKKSNYLAELVGIILGDGGITHDQLKITLNKETEGEYIGYVARLLKSIFNEEPKIYQYSNPKVKVCNLALSGVNLVSHLARIGIYKGNKVTRQASVPEWVTKNKSYSLACLRGLVDTDGGIYYHRHNSGGHSYFNLGLTFTSASQPLVGFVHQTLVNLGFAAKQRPLGVFLYREAEVVKYIEIIRPSNIHHIKRFREFFNLKGRSVAVAHRVRLESA